MSRYVHFASRLTGWNAIKSRATQLKIEMTDEECKECTQKIKALADIRPIAVDDADSIIRAFHCSTKLGNPTDLTPNMTEKENALNGGNKQDPSPSKKRPVDNDAELPIPKKVCDTPIESDQKETSNCV